MHSEAGNGRDETQHDPDPAQPLDRLRYRGPRLTARQRSDLGEQGLETFPIERWKTLICLVVALCDRKPRGEGGPILPRDGRPSVSDAPLGPRGLKAIEVCNTKNLEQLPDRLCAV